MADRTPHTVVLTVADHAWNGFISLGRFDFDNEEDARHLLDATDALIPDEAVPGDEADFWFLLDLHVGADPFPFDCIDTSARPLPLQIAQRLGGDAVTNWLAERPNPNRVDGPIPVLPTPALMGSDHA